MGSVLPFLQGRSAVSFFLERPVQILTAVAAGFYYLNLEPFEWYVRLLLLIPVLILNLLAGFFLEKILRRWPGLQQKEARSNQKRNGKTAEQTPEQTPETIGEQKTSPLTILSLSLVLIVLIAVTDFYSISLWAVLAFGIVFLWMLVALLQKKTGLALTLFSSIYIFTVVFYSYKLLAVEAREYVSFTIADRMKSIQTDQRISQWVKKNNGNQVLMINGERVMEVPVSHGDQLYDRDHVPESLRIFRIFGRVTGVYRSGTEEQNPLPLILLLDPPFKEKPSIEELVREARPVLLHLSMRGLSGDAASGQKLELEQGKWNLEGIRWELSNETGEKVLLTVLYTRGYARNRIAFLILAPPVEGFGVHPDVLDFLSHSHPGEGS